MHEGSTTAWPLASEVDVVDKEKGGGAFVHHPPSALLPQRARAKRTLARRTNCYYGVVV